MSFGEQMMIRTTGKISLELNGRGGCFTFKDGDRIATISTEMSGNPAYDLLLYLDGLREWTEPKGVALTRNEEDDVLRALVAWEDANATRTDLPEWARKRLK
jgi:hypothetical protein